MYYICVLLIIILFNANRFLSHIKPVHFREYFYTRLYLFLFSLKHLYFLLKISFYFLFCLYCSGFHPQKHIQFILFIFSLLTNCLMQDSRGSIISSSSCFPGELVCAQSGNTYLHQNICRK